MMMQKYSLIIFICIIASDLCTGQSQQFKYRRAISGIKNQWHTLLLPDDIFEKTQKDQSDIRIYGLDNTKDTIEVPFIRKVEPKKPQPAPIPFILINQSNQQDNHFFTFELKTIKTINSIALDFGQENFDWRIHLQGSQDQKEWYAILSDYRILSVKNVQMDYRYQKLEFQESKFKYYRVTIKSKVRPTLRSASIFTVREETKPLKRYAVNSLQVKNDKILKKTVIDITMKNYVPVTNIMFYIHEQTDYYRHFTLQYISDSTHTDHGWNYHYTTLTSDILNSMEKNTFECATAIVKKMSIIIENQDNQPLHIDSVLLYGPVYSITARFGKEDIPYFIYYGAMSLRAPQYDISYFDPPESLTIVPTGDEEILGVMAPNIASPLFQNKIWLWTIILAVILLLGWFGYTMIKNTG